MHLRINPLEPDILIALLQIGDECGINVVRQDHRILSLFLEHLDILALLLFVRHIVDIERLFFLLFSIGIFHDLCFYGFRFAVLCLVGRGFCFAVCGIVRTGLCLRFLVCRCLCFYGLRILHNLYIVLFPGSLLRILNIFFQSQVLMLQVLIEDRALDLVSELLIL